MALITMLFLLRFGGHYIRNCALSHQFNSLLLSAQNCTILPSSQQVSRILERLKNNMQNFTLSLFNSFQRPENLN